MPALAARLRLRYRKSNQARGARGTRDTRGIADQQGSTPLGEAWWCADKRRPQRADSLSYCRSCGAVRRAPGGRALLASESASLVRWVRVIMSFAQAL